MPLSSAPPAHQRFLEKLATLTRADPRLLGIAVSGSLAEGTADAESDVDLQIVATDEDLASLLAHRDAFIRQFGTVLASFTGEHVGEPRLSIVLFAEELLHVDFKFVKLAAFSLERVEDPAILWERGGELSSAVRANPRAYPPVDGQWIEDRFWTWVHYIASKIKRGETLEALDSLGWLRSMALSPMARAAAGLPNRSSRFLERATPESAAALLRQHPSATEGAALKASLEESVALYRRFRGLYPRPLEKRVLAEEAVMKYVKALQPGDVPRQPC
jgi:predicted nucleotidyltransferase